MKLKSNTESSHVNPGNNEAEAKFKDINEANQVLSDAGKRAEYDRNWRQTASTRESSYRPAQQTKTSPSSTPLDMMDIMNLGADAMGRMFEQFDSALGNQFGAHPLDDSIIMPEYGFALMRALYHAHKFNPQRLQEGAKAHWVWRYK